MEVGDLAREVGRSVCSSSSLVSVDLNKVEEATRTPILAFEASNEIMIMSASRESVSFKYVVAEAAIRDWKV